MLKIDFLNDDNEIVRKIEYRSIREITIPLFSKIFNDVNIAKPSLHIDENNYSRVNIVLEHSDGAKEIFPMKKEDFINRANVALKMK